jgi:hypothetical protein
MKTLYLSIIVIAVGILIASSLQNVNATPYLSPQDLYKQSNMVFYGQVISKQTGPGPDYYYYQIKVETYFKNPQNSDSITVAGHKPDNMTRMSYPQFEVGDKAIFYINKQEGINTISPYSQKAGDVCDLHSFLGSAPLLGESTFPHGPAAASTPRLTDIDGNVLERILTNQEVVLSYDDIANNYPESRMLPVEVSIKNEDNGQQVFNKTQNLQMQACSLAGTLKWNFIPTEIGNYVASIVVDGNTKITMGFKVIFDSTFSNPQSIPSPLKQFKSGISAKDVKCKESLVLVIKNDGMPICVKPTTVDKLFKRGILQIETTVQTAGSQCNTEFIPKPFELKVFPNGTSVTVNYTPVFLMKPNSTGKICTNNWRTIPGMSYSGKVITGIGKDSSAAQDVTVIPTPNTITIDDTNKTIVYTITASKASGGFYRFSPMFSNCGGIPIAIGYDSTHSFDNDFPWLWETVPCPPPIASTVITGLTGIDVTYITKEYR